MRTKTITVVILLALASACFGQEKTPPIAIDFTCTKMDFVKLHLRGYSNTKVHPEKIVFWRPVFDTRSLDPRNQSTKGFVVLGRGVGHVTKQPDWRELGAKLRKVASDHGANAIAYERSSSLFRLQLAISNSKLAFLGRGLSSVGRAPQWH
jgi:hypothetical protein